MQKLLFMLYFVLCVAEMYALSYNQLHEHEYNVNDTRIVMDDGSINEVIFSFLPKKSVFLYDKNCESIRKCGELITQWQEQIESGELFLMINGYCSSFRSDDLSYRMAKRCSNQVKS